MKEIYIYKERKERFNRPEVIRAGKKLPLSQPECHCHRHQLTITADTLPSLSYSYCINISATLPCCYLHPVGSVFFLH
ncbi:hypothetical protein PIB30_065753 [Stylosanthes scabra]|uniref:Uncharacterized protein n=1 Tax=Stylosanthes scabra TaxID=79078 RepID=A0ABU6WM38_9FABA|nr:hypothetical protein [Stylosanthes scabra]